MKLKMQQILSLYRALLQREADAISLYAFELFLRRGGTMEEIKAILLGSSEYFHLRGQSQNDRFLTALYQDVLCRTIDQESLLGGLQALERGMSRNAYAYYVVTSVEADQRAVQDLYQQHLHREAQDSELAFGVHLLQHGLLNEQVVSALIASEEHALLGC